MMVLPAGASASDLDKALELIKAVSEISDPKKLKAALEALANERKAIDANLEESVTAANAAKQAERDANIALIASQKEREELGREKVRLAQLTNASLNAEAEAKAATDELAAQTSKLAAEKDSFDRYMTDCKARLIEQQSAGQKRIDDALSELNAKIESADVEHKKAKALAAEYESKLEKLRALV